MLRKRRHVRDGDLLLLASRDLPEARALAAHEHLARCAACRTRLTRLESLITTYSEARQSALDPLLPPSEPARAHLRDAVAAASSERPGRVPGWTLPVVLACAALAVFAATIAIARHSRPGGRPPVASANRRDVPDPSLTPGLADSRTRQDLCPPAAGSGPARVSRQMALAVFRAHGIPAPRPRAYELDHLVPPELGGATARENLWPQPYKGLVWNAGAKDALEDRLLDAMCSGEVSLSAAQRALAADWVAAYRKYFGANEPLVEHLAFLKDEPWQ